MMFEGLSDVEAYEDELYGEVDSESDSCVDSEVEFQLYSQVHYSQQLPSGTDVAAADTAADKTAGASGNAAAAIVSSTPRPLKPEVIVISSDDSPAPVMPVSSIRASGRAKEATAVRRAKRATPHVVVAGGWKATRGGTHGRVRETITLETEGSDTSHAQTLDDSSDDKDSGDDDDDGSSSVRSWMLLGDKGRGKRDALEKPEEIMINLKGDGRQGREFSSEGDSEGEWTVNEKDMEASLENKRAPSFHSTRIRYYDKTVTCRNCDKQGHLSKNCPSARKLPTCGVCGTKGHVVNVCPFRLCPNCHRPGHVLSDCIEKPGHYKQCHRCCMTGHYADECPDTWRQFHLTVEPGPLVRPPVEPDRAHARVFCYNCAAEGHYGHECVRRRMDLYIYPTVPFICHYDSPHEFHLREKRLQRIARELREMGQLQESLLNPLKRRRLELEAEQGLSQKQRTRLKARLDRAEESEAARLHRKRQQLRTRRHEHYMRRTAGLPAWDGSGAGSSHHSHHRQRGHDRREKRAREAPVAEERSERGFQRRAAVAREGYFPAEPVEWQNDKGRKRKEEIKQRLKLKGKMKMKKLREKKARRKHGRCADEEEGGSADRVPAFLPPSRKKSRRKRARASASASETCVE
ncbi:zinc finger CCHC domain-containing protein 7 [Petromyzon marinus]|uniref:zinc finger CCHC domain-containing protein 7 n=1 Tax=Petromyzon marinus TaxID=7757 RepID=UPI003F6F749C